jgi:hypothetical protein
LVVVKNQIGREGNFSYTPDEGAVSIHTQGICVPAPPPFVGNCIICDAIQLVVSGRV